MKDGIDPRLVKLAAKVVQANIEANRRFVVAESCTGGLVSAALTAVPGASAVFEAGFITYANSAKMKMLGVDSNILDTFGSVSIATAWDMAQGALKHSTADVAVAITGVAGPDGGSDEKPIGMIVFARAIRGANPNDVVADKREFGDLGRGPLRVQAAKVALELLIP